MFDSHAHLDLINESKEAWARATVGGIRGWLVPGTRLIGRSGEEERRQPWRFPEYADSVHWAVGAHPGHIEAAELDWGSAKLEAAFEELVQVPGTIAVGEVGFDRRLVPRVPWRTQERFFRAGLEVARRARLPLVIHLVRAEQELLRVVERAPEAGAVLHGFSGNAEVLEGLVKRGFWISFGPSLVRRFQAGAQGGLVEAARGAPRDRVLVETDAPDQGSLMSLFGVAEVLAHLWEVPLAEVRMQTWRNAESFLGLDGRGSRPFVAGLSQNSNRET